MADLASLLSQLTAKPSSVSHSSDGKNHGKKWPKKNKSWKKNTKNVGGYGGYQNRNNAGNQARNGNSVKFGSTEIKASTYTPNPNKLPLPNSGAKRKSDFFGEHDQNMFEILRRYFLKKHGGSIRQLDTNHLRVSLETMMHDHSTDGTVDIEACQNAIDKMDLKTVEKDIPLSYNLGGEKTPSIFSQLKNSRITPIAQGQITVLNDIPKVSTSTKMADNLTFELDDSDYPREESYSHVDLEIDQLRQDYTQLTTLVATQNAEIVALKSTVKILSEALQLLSASVTKQDKSLENLTSDVSSLKDDVLYIMDRVDEDDCSTSVPPPSPLYTPVDPIKEVNVLYDMSGPTMREIPREGSVFQAKPVLDYLLTVSVDIDAALFKVADCAFDEKMSGPQVYKIVLNGDEYTLRCSYMQSLRTLCNQKKKKLSTLRLLFGYLLVQAGNSATFLPELAAELYAMLVAK